MSGVETNDFAGGKQYLSRLDDRNCEDDEGQYIAATLIKKMPLITNKIVRKEIACLTTDPVNWRVSRVAFAKGNPKVLQLLQNDSYRPTSQW